MRTMMNDGGVHDDVINKLWQVYSRLQKSWIHLDIETWTSAEHEGTDQALPKNQRQGAIIILGMLAVAKREVVTERVEALLKIGLGPLGMVSRPLR